MPLIRKSLLALVLVWVAACSQATRGEARSPRGQPVLTSAPIPPNAWPIRSSEYVDLWLHGFAMLTGDTSHVPLFERGYRDKMLAIRHQRNIYTLLDANQERLSRGFVDNPALVNAEFAIFQFNSFEQVVQVGTLFIQNEGYPPGFIDARTEHLLSVFQQGFKTVADRDWLRVFLQSLQDEQTRFYAAYWTSEETARSAARQTLDSMWTATYRARFFRYLRPARLADGSFILSLPLGGEGRSVTDPQYGNAVAVTFPASPATAVDAIYVFAHEVIASVSGESVSKHATPAEVKSGAAERYGPAADVRGGALLLQRVAPELVQGYMRYYMEVAAANPPAGDLTSAFAATFPISDAIRNGIEYQLGLMLGGI
ncbi:MAG TPA: hypothetical protein VMH39_04100 [Gemmatimonadaceae bacterium]|nr:hypothetical protein [Gemmatimonadaceae bacterium]